ncbi:hypothetical protein BpHYR1_014782 [Brachionus plicatilis]|uniref:Secreted protein n=1 Tax=Brachionus plicatilis TaxID=10195 RepID=A0A3M7RWD1_BRAPC|nr:hypothetical protein BpHYR1_014782 [Brachionus plicatilis]
MLLYLFLNFFLLGQFLRHWLISAFGEKDGTVLTGYRFRLGNNSGVDDQLDAVTSVSGRSHCSKRKILIGIINVFLNR